MAREAICGWNGDSKRVRLRHSIAFALAVMGALASSVAKAQTPAEFEQQLQRAAAAQKAGDVQGAIVAYNAALKIQPGSAELWSNLGLMQHQAGDKEGALESFTKAHRLQSKLFVPVLFLGIENLELSKPKEAIPYLEQAGRINPHEANLAMYLGRAYFGTKDFQRAELAYAQAAKSNAKNGEAWYRLGLTQLELAERDAGILAKEHRLSGYFGALEADTLSSQASLDRAITSYATVLRNEPKPPCLRSSFGFALLQQKKLDAAEAEFSQDADAGGCSIAQLGLLRIAFDRDPSSADLSSLARLWTSDAGFVENYLSRMSVGMTAEQFTSLEAQFDRTIFVGIGSEDVARMRAALHGASMTTDAEQPERVGNPARAPQEYRSGRYRICVSDLLPALASRSQEKLSMLASCALYTGKFETVLEVATIKRPAVADEALYWSIRARQGLAVRSLVKAGEVEPNSIRMHELLGETYRDMDHYVQAEEEYAAALRIDPADFSALIGAAATYLQEYRLEAAWRMINHALAQRPSDPEAHYIAGEVLIDQHQFDQAEPHLKEALAGNTDLVPRIHALLGTVYSHQGRDQQAMDELKQGLASDDDGSVHYRLARLYQKTGQTKLAEAEFAETRRLQSANEIEVKQVPGQPGASNQRSPRIAETSK